MIEWDIGKSKSLFKLSLNDVSKTRSFRSGNYNLAMLCVGRSSESKNQASYRCTECEQTFGILSALYRHMRVHADNGIPDTGSSTKQTFDAVPGSHVCKTCGRAFLSVLKLHIHRHIHRAWGRVTYVSHGKKKHDEVDEGGECTVCDRSFRYKRCLLKHKRQHGKQKPTLGSVVATWLKCDPTIAQEITNTRSFHCTECVCTFDNINDLCGHVRIHCIRSDKQLLKPLPLQVGNFQCNVCERQFLTESDLNVHCAENADAHECLECGRRIGSALYLRIHRLAHKDSISQPLDSKMSFDKQSNDVPHVCPICSSVIKKAEHLRQHMAVHTGDKRHICHVCAKQFARKGQLKRHLLIHDGERQFECAKCGKRFLLRDMLRRHLRAVHERQRPHLCSLCGRPFAEKHQLRTHMKIHARNPSAT
jgi:KRAB domain-containing zinc finger protein